MFSFLRGLFRPKPQSTDQGEPLRCVFCGATIPTVDQAIDAGWLPSYAVGDDEQPGPVCPSCAKAYLRFCPEEGDFALVAFHS